MCGWDLTWTSERSIRVRPATGEPGPQRAAWLADWLMSQEPTGVLGAVPSGAGVLLEFDMRDEMSTDPWAMTAALLEAFDREAKSEADTSAERLSRAVVIPVCYDPSVAPDIARVGELLDCVPERVIELHADRAYRVETMGFMPGFAYMGSLDESLRLPRLETPRARVPAGSVAIAERMTGVYPHQSAGGWLLIGRTPLSMFQAHESDPALLRVGDRVRFEPIELGEYQDRSHSNSGVGR